MTSKQLKNKEIPYQKKVRAKQEAEGKSPALKHGAYSAALKGGRVDGRTSLGQAREIRAKQEADVDIEKTHFKQKG